MQSLSLMSTASEEARLRTHWKKSWGSTWRVMSTSLWMETLVTHLVGIWTSRLTFFIWRLRGFWPTIDWRIASPIWWTLSSLTCFGATRPVARFMIPDSSLLELLKRHLSVKKDYHSHVSLVLLNLRRSLRFNFHITLFRSPILHVGHLSEKVIYLWCDGSSYYNLNRIIQLDIIKNMWINDTTS